jgi:hypothetical protein
LARLDRIIAARVLLTDIAQTSIKTREKGMRANDGSFAALLPNHFGFSEIVSSPESKIFRFRSHPNQSHNSACLTADEGRWPSYERA